ncbi:molybdopterin-guanine dinucleotide biosynthesis protein B [Domibacillus mangrovi]|uniref:Molybdopterin-guanine dinucleotide biosynthesis protein B n=1 Tax=Domibacillus mangrovi TaxID=1714354 RepID=A0A1Q5P5P5_9BACI|nr:molybdopterin-guanine dinucleotide biosynthesis protein B [Domibacillus mangrovi]OKL37471.1 molybdopterin-guanine dinucleotide biosynthesis protein B [Domibacillus mangrovi]
MKHIFQVVGYQNSGKTTLLEKLIACAAAEGLRIASIKHHGHGGMPDTKDSTRHQQAGAIISGVEGGGALHLHIQREKWKLDDILQLYQLFSVDLILIEGYKLEEYPKVVLIRNEDDLSLLELENIQCVISWINIEKWPARTYPIFHIIEETDYLDYLKAYLYGQR